MSRTVVPPPDLRDGGGVVGAGDKYPDKLVKYVPAETLAFFVPAAAGLGSDEKTWLIVVFFIGLAGTIGYLWNRGQDEKPDKRPLTHFYVLAGVAFCCWAVGTSGSVADLVGIDDTGAGVILGAAVFIVPLTDEVLTRRARARR